MEPYRFSPAELAVTTVNDFVKACQAEPVLAAEHLQSGYFEPWLRDVGRPDLADAAARLRQSKTSSSECLQQFVDMAIEPSSRPRTPAPSRQAAPKPAAAKPTAPKPAAPKPRARKPTDR